MQLATSSTTEGAEAFANGNSTADQVAGSELVETLRAICTSVRPLPACGADGGVRGIGTASAGASTGKKLLAADDSGGGLRPDFTTTISRGVLRLGGTFAGLLLATLFIICFLTPRSRNLSWWVFLRIACEAGPANYGMFSVAVSGLIVFLIAMTGVSPGEVIGRARNRTRGRRVLALVAYALWPTWERTQVSDVMAEMIDRTRDYFRAVTMQLMDDRVRDGKNWTRTRRVTARSAVAGRKHRSIGFARNRAQTR